MKPSAKIDSKVVNALVYRQIIGSLIYLTTTSANLSYSLSFISRFMIAPKVEHLIAMKRVLRHVKWTLDFSTLYSTRKDPRLCGYTHSNWSDFIDDRKSIFRYVFILGTLAVTWTSKNQHAIVLSTKAEYHKVVKVTCEVVWLQRMLSNMKM